MRRSKCKYTPVRNEGFPNYRPGTPDYIQWWNLQVKRCREGYKPTGGVWIPGMYYFYLNFCKVELYDPNKNRKVMDNPFYRDMDHEYMQEIYDAKKNGYGLIVLKARRKGFSFMNSGVLLYDWTFNENSESGIGAQTENYVSDFRRKMMLSYNQLPAQLRLQVLRNREDILMSGYKEKVDGVWIEKGFLSKVHFRVMENPDAFRGTSLNYMIFEEAGEFKKLRKAYLANEECFREGAIQFGLPIIGGTSNQMSHDSEDYMYMWNNADKFNLKPIFISAAKVYGGFWDLKTGKSDESGAKEDILQRRKIKKQSSKIEYYTFLQEMPLEPADAFVSLGGNGFDIDKINTQITKLMTDKRLSGIVRTGRLEWGKDSNGRRVFGKKPEFVEDIINGTLKIIEMPLENQKNADIAGVDVYHSDDSFEEGNGVKTSDSKGCMCVYRRFVNMDTPGEMPIAFYTDRPYSKEEFYERCLMLCVFYGCQVLPEHNDDGFLKYFERNKMLKYLKERPRSADAPYSQVSNRYGIHMKGYQKQLLFELVDEYVRKHSEDIYFIELLRELIVFGSKNTDYVMAFGLALIHNMDAVKRIVQDDEDEKLELPTFTRDVNGGLVYGDGKKSSKKPTFDYDLD